MLQLQRKMRRSRKGVLWYVSVFCHWRKFKVTDFQILQVSEVVELIDRRLLGTTHFPSVLYCLPSGEGIHPFLRSVGDGSHFVYPSAREDVV